MDAALGLSCDSRVITTTDIPPPIHLNVLQTRKWHCFALSVACTCASDVYAGNRFVPLGFGVLLAVAATVFGVLTAAPATSGSVSGLFGKVTAAAEHPGIVGGGLLIALVCLLVGSAAGALCNPPLLRHPGVAMLSTLSAIVIGLVTAVSPANAAISHTQAQAAGPLTANWPGPGALAGAACLLAVTWAVSLYAAARRDTRTLDSA